MRLTELSILNIQNIHREKYRQVIPIEKSHFSPPIFGPMSKESLSNLMNNLQCGDTLKVI